MKELLKEVDELFKKCKLPNGDYLIPESLSKPLIKKIKSKINPKIPSWCNACGCYHIDNPHRGRRPMI